MLQHDNHPAILYNPVLFLNVHMLLKIIQVTTRVCFPILPVSFELFF